MRSLASIQKILDIQPIEGADSIEVVSVLGWKVVSRKGEFKIGELCAYFEVDSLLPKQPWNDFLFAKETPNATTFRLKTIRLRGQVSQGLVVPLHKIVGLPNTEGEDITERLGIIKWEPVVPACLNGEVSGPRPSYIPMTDEPRIQSNPGLIEEYKGRSVYVSVKLDGTSSSFANYDGVFSVCGRNFCFKEGVENVYWEVAKKYNLEQKLKEAGNFAIQGECVGNGIQKNPLRIPKHDLYIFNVINLDNKKLLSLNEMKLFCKKYELQMVPVIFEGIFNWKTVEELLELSKGKYDSGVLREGIVIRPTEPSYSPILGGRSSFKVINSDYLLKFD